MKHAKKTKNNNMFNTTAMDVISAGTIEEQALIGNGTAMIPNQVQPEEPAVKNPSCPINRVWPGEQNICSRP